MDKVCNSERQEDVRKVSDFKNERELQDDLAEYLRSAGMLTFTEIQIPGMHGSRADVIAMTPHRYSTKDIRLYEVKLTRGVWLADKKFQKYLECCNRMYIACPKGVIKKDEVPKEIGLITRSDNGWRVAKSPRLNINPPKMDIDFILSLLYRGYEETKIQRDLRDRGIASSNYKLRDVAYKVGFDIGRRLDRTKDAKVEKWCDELWEVFKKFGVEAPGYKTDDLPSVYDIENLLGGASALMQDVATIKAIGTYLENIELPEAQEGRLSWRNRKDNREKALQLIGKEKNS